jgi:hypothetical protein
MEPPEVVGGESAILPRSRWRRGRDAAGRATLVSFAVGATVLLAAVLVFALHLGRP